MPKLIDPAPQWVDEMALLRKLRKFPWRKSIANTVRHIIAIPPMTPPTIAPVLFCFDPPAAGVGLGVSEDVAEGVDWVCGEAGDGTLTLLDAKLAVADGVLDDDDEADAVVGTARR